jgi:general secretion pathway protein K
MLALLAVLLLGFVSGTRTELQIARNQEETASARETADAGVALAVLGMLDPSVTTRWHATGEAHDVNFGHGKIRVSVQDEGGKIDLNDAPPALLSGLFQTLGLSDETAEPIVAAIMARRNAVAAQGGGGSAAGPPAAAIPDQTAASPDQAAASPDQKAFLTIDELRLLPGVTPALYDRLRPYVTVFSARAEVNPLTAPAAVLDSVPGADAGAVAAFITARDASGASEETLPPLTGMGGLAAGPVQTFTVTAQGSTATGARFIREAVVALGGNSGAPAQYLSWRQAPGIAADAR